MNIFHRKPEKHCFFTNKQVEKKKKNSIRNPDIKPFEANVSFSYHLKTLKTGGLHNFSGGTKREHCPEMSLKLSNIKQRSEQLLISASENINHRNKMISKLSLKRIFLKK